MANLALITSPAAVRTAIAECDLLGREAFLNKYGFRRATRYFLKEGANRYDSKAILGAAHGVQYPEQGPLRAEDFSGGEKTTMRRLAALGFEIVVLDAGQESPLNEPTAPGNGDRKPRSWVILTFGSDRQYGGNTGYEDSTADYYSYDSEVGNHRQVSNGDVAIVCDRKLVVGAARIDRIDSVVGTKEFQRCPVCKTTGIKARKTKRPRYRCNEGHEFDDPFSITPLSIDKSMK